MSGIQILLSLFPFAFLGILLSDLLLSAQTCQAEFCDKSPLLKLLGNVVCVDGLSRISALRFPADVELLRIWVTLLVSTWVQGFLR